MFNNYENTFHHTSSLNIVSDGLTSTSINPWTTKEQKLFGSTSSDFSTQYSQPDNYELYDTFQVKPPNSFVDINYPSVIAENENAVFNTDNFGGITDKSRDLLTGNLANSNQSVVNTAAAIAHQIISIEQSGGGNENRSTLHNDIIDAASKTRVAPNVNEWDEADFLIWKTPIFGNPNYIHEFKEQWVDGYKDVIKTAARKFDLPELLLGGVAYNEVGGDPLWIDDAAYATRKFDHMADPYLENLTITSEPELTSFGNLSIQVRRASQTLGYQPSNLDSTQEQIIIDSLKDPRQNIFIAAAHLAELRDIDFKGKNADQMGLDEIKLTATRYNWGPDLSLEDIKKDTSYGDTIINKETIITELLKEDNLDGAVFA